MIRYAFSKALIRVMRTSVPVRRNWLANQVIVPEADPVAAGAAVVPEDEEHAALKARRAAAVTAVAAVLRLFAILIRSLPCVSEGFTSGGGGSGQQRRADGRPEYQA